MEEPALSSLFLTTVPLDCYVRIDEKTEKYESAMYLLAYEDDQIAIMVDTESKLIMACSLNQCEFYLDLPFADAIQDATRKLYEAAIAIQDLKSVTGPTGEQLKVLFER